MCFSQPDIPTPPPPPAPPPPPLPTAERAVTKRATQPTKRKRGTQQLTAVRRSTLNMGNAARSGVGVQLSQ